jgi:hypothetical protein
LETLPKTPHALIIVGHTELQDGAYENEITPEEVEQIRANIPVPRQQSVLGNLLAARRAAVTFVQQNYKIDVPPAKVAVVYRTDGKPELRFNDADVSQASLAST